MKRHRVRTACGALALALAVAVPGAAQADNANDVEGARAFFMEASRLGKAGRWREARELYLRSLVLKPTPLTHYGLGVAQKETGRLTEALGSFRMFLAEPVAPATAPFQAPARAAIAELEGRIGHVTIEVDPSPIVGLALTVDGQPVPPAVRGAREIDPGFHEVVARAPGFRDTSTRFVVGTGGTVTVAVALHRPFGMAAPQATATDIVGPVQTPEVAAIPEPPSRAVPIGLLATGGALFGVGLAVGLVGVHEANNAPTRDGSDATTARTTATAGDVVASAGILSAGIGLILLLVQRRPKAAEPAPPTALFAPPGRFQLVTRF